MVNAILKTLHFFNDYERELHSAIHLRRQIIAHMVGHIDLLYKARYSWKLWMAGGGGGSFAKGWPIQYLFMGHVHEG